MEEVKESKNQIKQIVKEWCEVASTNGLPFIAKSKYLFITIMWILALATSAAICSYLVYSTVFDYLSYPTTTSVRLVQEVPAQFPAISFCNLNRFNLADETVKQTFDTFAKNAVINPESVEVSIRSIVKSIKSYMFNMNNTQKMNLGYKIEDMLLFCLYDLTVCNASDFEWFYNFEYGNCFRFNSDGSKFISKSGSRFSLQLSLVLGDGTSNHSIYSTEKGLRILVNNYTVSFNNVFEHGINIAPGYRSYISIKRTLYDRLPAPYNDCIDDLTSKSKDKTFIMGVMFDRLNQTLYDQDFCESLTLQQIILDNCSCIDAAFPFRNMSEPKCISVEQLVCESAVMKKVNLNPELYLRPSCPEACDHNEYEAKVSQSTVLTEWYWNTLKSVSLNASQYVPAYKKLANIDSFEKAKENYISFYLNYEKIGYDLIQESSFWDIFSLLSNIGGNTGLFVGMSFLSFLEIVELLILLSVRLVEKYFKPFKNRNRNIKPFQS